MPDDHPGWGLVGKLLVVVVNQHRGIDLEDNQIAVSVKSAVDAEIIEPEALAHHAEFSWPQILGARVLFVTTVGRDEEVIRAYIRNQELADRQLEQFELKISAAQNPINRPNIP